jgi:hypothetical protein
MSLASGIIIVGLIAIVAELGSISKTLSHIRDGQKDHLDALLRLSGDEPMARTIEAMNDAGATLTDEMLEYKHGILVRIHSQLRGIARAIADLAPQAPAEPPRE